MSNKTALIFSFALGVGVGVFSTWKYFRNKYEKIAQDEIDSVKEVFSKRAEIKKHQNKSDINVYQTLIEKNGYKNYSNEEHIDASTADEEEEEFMMGPYVITPDEFGEKDNYEQISLTYYIDGILADDFDEPIDDIDDVIGLTAVNHFGEYEPDSVFVRNDERKCDYEVLLDQREYSKIHE